MMSETVPEAERTVDFRRVPLGQIETARSRHMWTRSAVHVAESGGLVVTGTWDGTVTARDADTLEARWTVDHPDHAVGIASLEAAIDEGADTIVVAGRGEMGTIAAYDAETGDRRWRYDTADDVGEAVKETVFYLPYVVALETGTDSDGNEWLYAAARRYERDGETRRWHSTVYAFDADGSVRWTYETDASPIALDLDSSGERLAVGYNRCMGEHDTGLVVVLEADSGDLAWTWDPGTDGDRRVGDVSVDGDSIAVSRVTATNAATCSGLAVLSAGTSTSPSRPKLRGETLYAYPNHAYANDGRVAFVTGNTYAAVESRETESRHPNEHRIAAFDADGDLVWDDEVRGFVHGLAADDGRLVTPAHRTSGFAIRIPTPFAGSISSPA